MKKTWRITNRTWVFLLIWIGQLVSLVGSGLTRFALAVWVYQDTGSVTQFSMVAFFGTLLVILLSPFAGALADRWDRRTMMLLSDVGAGISSLLLLLLLLRGTGLELWHIYLVTAISSACDAFQWPAYQASVSLLVSKENLGRASGMLQLGPAVAQIITPLLAGFLLASIGLPGIITVDLSTLVAALFILLIVEIPRPEATKTGDKRKGTLWQEAGYGWRYIKERPGLFALLLFFAAINLTIGLMVVLITPLVLSFSSVSVLGMVSSFSGLGMLLGGVVMSLWGGPHPRMRGVFGFAIPCGLLLLLGGLRPNATLIAIAGFVFLFCTQIVSGSARAIWQVKVERDVQGRVFAVRRMIGTFTSPLARLLAGPLADYVFEPLLVAGGPLAGSVGLVLGTGPGRGIGLLFIVLGLSILLITATAYSYPRLRKVEEELPDMITDKENAKTSKKSLRDPAKARKRRLYFAGGAFALLCVLALGLVWFVRRPWPQVEGTLSVPGLEAPVEVLRDAWGVPHIYADNEHDLLFAQGFVHAQDRLWQMESSRRLAKGRLSEALGKSSVRLDLYVRSLRLYQVAEESWARIDADSRPLVEAYAEGVNAYVDSRRGRLPVEFTLAGIEFEPWSPVDTLAFGNVQSLLLSGNLKFEIVRMQMTEALGAEIVEDIFPPFDPAMPLIIPAEADLYQGFGADFSGLDEIEALLGDPTNGWGSNDWVVHGDRTASGMPILANDTHLGTQMPSIWYANGLHGGRFDSVGFTFPGVPLVIIGHNEDIAWGTTNLGPDTQDFYLEKLDDEENPTQYEFMGEWRDLEFVEERIDVRGGDTQTFTVTYTHHGPLLNEIFSAFKETGATALHWTLFEGNALMQSVVHLNLATNWDEFRDALRDWDLPSQNFVYADMEGNIGYQSPGRIPIRAEGHQGTLPVPGWSGEYEWQGYIPFEELPAVLNPPDGFVATANNKVTPDDYPHHLTYDWFPGYRAERINDLLAASEEHTVESIAAIHGQTYSLPAEAIRPYMLAIDPSNELETEALEFLSAWDLYLDPEEVGATIYEAWYLFTLRNTIGDEMGTDPENQYLRGNYQRHGTQHVPLMIRLLEDPQNKWFDDVSTPEVEQRDDILSRSLAESLAWLQEEYGRDPQNWEWGRVHTVTFAHQLLGKLPLVGGFFNAGPIPVGGDAFSVNAAGFSWVQPFEMGHGVAQRMIIDFSDFDKAVGILPTGQSEHVFHEHREDMLPLWAEVEYISLPFSRQAVDANTESRLTLQP